MTHIATVRRLWKTALAGALCAAAFSPSGLAQVPPPTILQIETANNVLYADDTDPSKFATDPSVTTPMARTFSRTFVLADIQAVNGQRAMGTAAASLIGTAF